VAHGARQLPDAQSGFDRWMFQGKNRGKPRVVHIFYRRIRKSQFFQNILWLVTWEFSLKSNPYREANGWMVVVVVVGATLDVWLVARPLSHNHVEIKFTKKKYVGQIPMWLPFANSTHGNGNYALNVDDLHMKHCHFPWLCWITRGSGQCTRNWTKIWCCQPGLVDNFPKRRCLGISGKWSCFPPKAGPKQCLNRLWIDVDIDMNKRYGTVIVIGMGMGMDWICVQYVL
jgi:hypothetical protein